MTVRFKLPLILFLFITSIPLAAQAFPIGNPTNQASPQQLTIGPTIDIYSQDFKSNGYKITGKGDRLLFNFKYGIDRNMGFFGNAGFSDESIDYGSGTADGKYGLGVEIGAKATLGEVKREHIKFGGGAKLALARSSIDFGPGLSSDADWSEFGLFGGLSFENQPELTPYLGLQITKTTTKIADPLGPGGQTDFDQDGLLGLFGGLDFNIQKGLSLGMELRIISELSATLNLNFAL
ncbi:MAG: hypothetical protein HY200_04635 [Nitrospirae bacterium]|nr:hypothetical protein [Nitrospirota bacterium]MBI3594223.1 hypothetical protein [Nitrospirota bacterium]